MIILFIGLLIAMMIGIPFINMLYVGYVQLGWFKIFFHDMLKQCVPEEWRNEPIGHLSNCRYCKKRIVNRKYNWKRRTT